MEQQKLLFQLQIEREEEAAAIEGPAEDGAGPLRCGSAISLACCLPACIPSRAASSWHEDVESTTRSRAEMEEAMEGRKEGRRSPAHCSLATVQKNII